MSRDDFQLARDIFAEICDATPEQQRMRIEERCADQPAARELVEAMLREDAANDFTLQPPATLLSDLTKPAQPECAPLPEQIGRYRILGICGRGGMGTVYEAEQDNPRRRVALKMIRASVSSREIRQRFRREADVLGRLQHPGIAQIFEAGTATFDDERRPYFAMEFVEGQSLTRYVQTHSLPVRDRLELLARVCDAVHYAHQRGIIHRDLKPDNILVAKPSRSDSGLHLGQPKILDFGIARMTDSDVQNTMQTNVGQLIGTLQYMSPEQAASDPNALDIRSDIYSLGVILFELLTERLPYELHQFSVPQSLRTIQEATPTRLSHLDSTCRGDVETIVEKCLEKEPEQRYQSASELAEDLRRYLRDEPIAARPPSTFYQLRKFARRNRALVGGMVATMLALVAGVIATGVFALQARHLATESRAQSYAAMIVAAQSLVDRDPRSAATYLEQTPPERRNWEWRYLKHQLEPQLPGLASESPSVGRPALAPDGALLAIGEDGVIRRWADETPGLGSVVAALGVEVTHAAFDRNATRVAAITPEQRVVGFDLAAGVALPIPPLPGADHVGVGWDGDRLVAAQPRSIATWSAAARPAQWDVRPVNPGNFGSSPVFDLVIAPGRDRAIVVRRFWPMMCIEISTGRVVAAHTDDEEVLCVALSPDGDQLAVGYRFRSVRILDPETFEERGRPGSHLGNVVGVAFSPDGSRLCSAGTEGTLRVWDLARPSEPALIVAGQPRAPLFSHDGQRILCLSVGSTEIARFRLSQGPRVLGEHASYVYGVSFSDDGALLGSAVFGHDGVIWDPHTGHQMGPLANTASAQPIFGMDGSALVTTDPARRFDARSGIEQAQRHVPATNVAHWVGYHEDLLGLSGVKAPPGQLSWRTEYDRQPDGTAVMRAFANDALLASRATSGAPYQVGQNPVPLFIGCEPTSVYAFRGHIAELIIFDGQLSEVDTQAMETYLAGRRAGGDDSLPDVQTAQLVAHFVADPRTIVRDADGEVQAWRAVNDSTCVMRSWKWTQGIQLVTQESGRTALECTGSGGLRGLLPPDASLEAPTVFWLGSYGGANCSAYRIGMPGLLDEAWQELLQRELGRLAGVQIGPQLAFSPDGKTLAHISGGIVWLSDVPQNRPPDPTRFPVHRIGATHRTYHGLAFHPDGRIALCEANGKIELWDPVRREKQSELQGHLGAVYAVAFSPDGTRLASGGNDTTVRLWDVERLEQVMELRGHDQYVKALAFSPDGSQIASGSGDKTIRIWDAPPLPTSSE